MIFLPVESAAGTLVMAGASAIVPVVIQLECTQSRQSQQAFPPLFNMNHVCDHRGRVLEACGSSVKEALRFPEPPIRRKHQLS